MRLVEEEKLHPLLDGHLSESAMYSGALSLSRCELLQDLRQTGSLFPESLEHLVRRQRGPHCPAGILLGTVWLESGCLFAQDAVQPFPKDFVIPAQVSRNVMHRPRARTRVLTDDPLVGVFEEGREAFELSGESL
jgi:hypothetical protein